MQPDTTAVRDELARLRGGMGHRSVSCPTMWITPSGRETEFHPIPDTIDGAAGCMPSEYRWGRGGGSWFAWRVKVANLKDGIASELSVPDTSNERADRFALALAAWKARKGKA